MLIRMSDLKNFQLKATDGDIGRCRDFLFDDEQWVVRYMEANTGKWLLGRRVLLSPQSLRSPDLQDDRLELGVSKDQVENAPGIEEDHPISRQYEQAHARYFNQGYYWVGGGLWGGAHNPYQVIPPADPKADDMSDVQTDDVDEHLRSAREVSKYNIRASDGDIGAVDDVIIDTSTWRVVMLSVDTRKWLPGRTVLLPVESVRDVSWVDRLVTVNVARDAIKSAPELEEPLDSEDLTKCDARYQRAREAA